MLLQLCSRKFPFQVLVPAWSVGRGGELTDASRGRPTGSGVRLWQRIPCFQPKKLTWAPRVSVPEGSSVPSAHPRPRLVFLSHAPVGLTSEGPDQRKPANASHPGALSLTPGYTRICRHVLKVNSTILLGCSPGGQPEISLAEGSQVISGRAYIPLKALLETSFLTF